MINHSHYDRQDFNCPNCNSSSIKIKGDLFQGIHWLADCLCDQCETAFFHTLPVGHSEEFPISFSKDGKHKRFSEVSKLWLAEPLINSVWNDQKITCEIEKVIYLKSSQAVLLNCLDNCYGHVLWQLLNADRHLKNNPELGLIILIPESFLWLIPEGTSEVWVVKSDLGRLGNYIENLDTFIKNEFKRFDSIFLSKAYTHLNHHKIDLTKFLKTKPFDLQKFEDIPTTITFVVREDRFWLNSSLLTFLYLFSIKFQFFNLLKKLFVARQRYLIHKLSKRISKRLKANFYVVGLGKTLKFRGDFQDLRQVKMNTEKELEWCKVYSKSHVVIGVHGSNMLIPTALAAGFINIMPTYKIPHITEDILQAYGDRKSQFLGRYFNDPTNTKLLNKHILSMLKSFPGFRDRLGDGIDN